MIMIMMMEIILKIFKKYLKNRVYVITNTIKTLTGEKRNNNTYILHPNYEETNLSNMQRKHHVH